MLIILLPPHGADALGRSAFFGCEDVLSLKSDDLVLPSAGDLTRHDRDTSVAMRQVTAPHPSLLPALARIAEIAKLPANWDGEGADPPTASAVAAACYVIEAVATRIPPATTSPIPDGGLQIEWRGPHARIDVQANPGGSYGYLVKWGTGADATYEEADEALLDVVLALIDRALSP